MFVITACTIKGRRLRPHQRRGTIFGTRIHPHQRRTALFVTTAGPINRRQVQAHQRHNTTTACTINGRRLRPHQRHLHVRARQAHVLISDHLHPGFHLRPHTVLSGMVWGGGGLRLCALPPSPRVLELDPCDQRALHSPMPVPGEISLSRRLPPLRRLPRRRRRPRRASVRARCALGLIFARLRLHALVASSW